MSIHKTPSSKELFNEIPQCRGYDDAAHRLFLTTNEMGQGATLNALRRRPLCGNTAVGASGFFLLNAVAFRNENRPKDGLKIKHIVIIDRSVRVEHFWNQVEILIKEANSKKDFQDSLNLLLFKEKFRYFKGYYEDRKNEGAQTLCIENLAELNSEIEENRSWLSTEDRFHRIQKIFKKNRFIFRRLDLFADPAPLHAVARILQNNQLNLDILYVSNIHEYIKHPQEKAHFLESVTILTAPQTSLIATESRECYCPDLKQAIYSIEETSIEEIFPDPTIQICKHSFSDDSEE